MPAQPQSTWIEVVNVVARSVGHPTTTDVASSTDEVILRLGEYANFSCTELQLEFDWEALNKFGQIDVVADAPQQVEKAFPLPADYVRLVDNTLWNRSTQLPAVGPVNPQDWQWLVVRKAFITFRFMWRIRLGQLWVKSPPETMQPLTFEYQSNLWAVDGVTDTPKTIMSNNSDFHILDPYAVILKTRLKWLEQEGYDTTATKRDFDVAIQAIFGGDRGAGTLSLVPGGGYPYINSLGNLPDTGYGI